MTALLDALVAFAARHGIRVDDPVVLGDTSNIVVHLRPAPVVARVPFITALGRDRPDVGLARELALATHLDQVGIPTIPPSDELPPGPHRLPNGRWVSFMQYVPLAPVSDTDAAAVGERLDELVIAASALADTGAVFDRSLVDETGVALDRLAGRIAAPDLELLRGWAADAGIGATGDAQPLHGDPHRQNVGRRADGELVWFDFDDGVRDSPLVDLATLLRNWPTAGRVACERRGVDPDGPEMAAYLAQRAMWGGVWSQYFATEVGGRWTVEAADVLAARRG